MNHHYHSIEGNTDLAVIRDQARARTKPSNKFGSQENSVVHFHRKQELCTKGQQHEFYPVEGFTTEALEETFWFTKENDE